MVPVVHPIAVDSIVVGGEFNCGQRLTQLWSAVSSIVVSFKCGYEERKSLLDF